MTAPNPLQQPLADLLKYALAALVFVPREQKLLAGNLGHATMAAEVALGYRTAMPPGAAPVDPATVSREELAAALRAMVNACAESGWPLVADHMMPLAQARAALAKEPS